MKRLTELNRKHFYIKNSQNKKNTYNFTSSKEKHKKHARHLPETK